jgi:hypothetical protein
MEWMAHFGFERTIFIFRKEFLGGLHCSYLGPLILSEGEVKIRDKPNISDVRAFARLHPETKRHFPLAGHQSSKNPVTSPYFALLHKLQGVYLLVSEPCHHLQGGGRMNPGVTSCAGVIGHDRLEKTIRQGTFFWRTLGIVTKICVTTVNCLGQSQLILFHGEQERDLVGTFRFMVQELHEYSSAA